MGLRLRLYHLARGMPVGNWPRVANLGSEEAVCWMTLVFPGQGLAANGGLSVPWGPGWQDAVVVVLSLTKYISSKVGWNDKGMKLTFRFQDVVFRPLELLILLLSEEAEHVVLLATHGTAGVAMDTAGDELPFSHGFSHHLHRFVQPLSQFEVSDLSPRPRPIFFGGERVSVRYPRCEFYEKGSGNKEILAVYSRTHQVLHLVSKRILVEIRQLFGIRRQIPVPVESLLYYVFVEKGERGIRPFRIMALP
jgi:hypothetical protein